MARNFITLILKITCFESLLGQVDTKLAFFESEVSFNLDAFTIVGNKHNVKTMVALNGYGAYCAPVYSYSNAVINHCLVPGNYYDKYLKPNNPCIDMFCPVGNHEIEDISTEDSELDLRHIRNNSKKIVSVLFNFYGFFFPETQGPRPFFDDNDAKKAFLYYWKPFFEWAGRQDDLFFIFKGKLGANQYEHSFLKELISIIPQDKRYQNDNMTMKDAITVSDCTICGCDANTSAFFSSLCLGVPSIAYDISAIGYAVAEKERYDRHIISRKSDELIANLEYILTNKLPESLFEKVRKDHHAEGKLDNQTSLRIKHVIAEVTEDK